jgi:Tol biopolymer transport system component
MKICRLLLTVLCLFVSSTSLMAQDWTFTPLLDLDASVDDDAISPFIRLSRDGNVIVFETHLDLVPSPEGPGNADGNEETFHLDIASGDLLQITDTTGAPANACVMSDVSADGSLIALCLAGFGGDPNAELYLHDVATGINTQLTHIDNATSYGVLFPQMTNAGDLIVFNSEADLDNDPGTVIDNSEHRDEVFLVNTVSGIITQITDSAAGEEAGDSQINGDGTQLAIEWNTQSLGGNADGSFEIWAYDINTGVFTQITDAPALPLPRHSITHTQRYMSTDGNRLVFESRADLTGDNPGGNDQGFLYDQTQQTITQLTNITSNSLLMEDISGDGQSIFLYSSEDLTGTSPNGFQDLFVIRNGHLSQFTDFDGSTGNFRMSASEDGCTVAFETHSSPHPSIIADGSSELYLATANQCGALAELIHALTQQPPLCPSGDELDLAKGGDMTGKHVRTNTNRLESVVDRLLEAEALLADGDTTAACNSLNSALDRFSGKKPWFDSTACSADIEAAIVQARSDAGCP